MEMAEPQRLFGPLDRRRDDTSTVVAYMDANCLLQLHTIAAAACQTARCVGRRDSGAALVVELTNAALARVVAGELRQAFGVDDGNVVCDVLRHPRFRVVGSFLNHCIHPRLPYGDIDFVCMLPRRSSKPLAALSSATATTATPMPIVASASDSETASVAAARDSAETRRRQEENEYDGYREQLARLKAVVGRRRPYVSQTKTGLYQVRVTTYCAIRPPPADEKLQIRRLRFERRLTRHAIDAGVASRVPDVDIVESDTGEYEPAGFSCNHLWFGGGGGGGEISSGRNNSDVAETEIERTRPIGLPPRGPLRGPQLTVLFPEAVLTRHVAISADRVTHDTENTLATYWRWAKHAAKGYWSRVRWTQGSESAHPRSVPDGPGGNGPRIGFLWRPEHAPSCYLVRHGYAVQHRDRLFILLHRFRVAGAAEMPTHGHDAPYDDAGAAEQKRDGEHDDTAEYELFPNIEAYVFADPLI